jgi:ATP-binding cassette subfamily F protein uup
VPASPASTQGKKKLSYMEVRDLSTIEDRIAEAEREVDLRRTALEDPAVTGDVTLLREACLRLEEAQKKIDDLYTRWAELEEKQRS